MDKQGAAVGQVKDSLIKYPTKTIEYKYKVSDKDIKCKK